MEKISEYSKANYKMFYLEKHFCDYNSGKEWRAGFITNITDDYAQIIDATNKSVTEQIFKKMKININDGKNISYFRKYSKPDNFMAKGSSNNLKVKLEQFTNFHKFFNEYFKMSEDFDFYYFLRVSVYYGLDFCMNPNINKNNNNENILISFRLILVILDIIVDCLKYIEKNLNEFIDYQNNIKNTDLNDLVLINKKFAIFSFYDDIHFLIKKIFGDSEQYLRWYIIFKNDINNFNPAAVENTEIKCIPLYKSENEFNIIINNDNNGNDGNKLMKKICVDDIYNNLSHKFNTLDQEISSCIIAYFTDYFNYIEGYKLLFRLTYSITDFKQDINFTIQYSFINDLYTAKAITDTFYNSHQEEIKKLQQFANNFLDKFDENNFDKINKKELTQFCNKIFDLTEKDKDKKEILNESININYIFRQMQFSKKLEKKISFLSELNNIIKSVEYNDLNKQLRENKNIAINEETINEKYKERNKDIKKMNSEYFCKMCHEKNIINIFLEDNTTHEEIIKRLPPLLKLMYSNNYGYPKIENEKDNIKQTTKHLFTTLFNKLYEAEKNNESLWKIITNIILDFIEILSKDDKFFVFMQIKDYLNKSIINKSTKIGQIFSLIINYSIKCIENLKKKNEENIVNIFNDLNLNEYDSILQYKFNEKQFYCLDILINFTLEKDKINKFSINKEQKINLINIYIDGIIEIIKKYNSNDKLLKIIFTKIIKGIASSINTVQNIILLEKLVKSNLKNEQFIKDIKDLCEKKEIMEQIIKQFYLYFTEVKSKNINNEINTDVIETINEDEDLYDYQTNLEKRLNFIFLLLDSNINITISFDKFRNLFNSLNLNNELEKQIFYSVIKNNILNIQHEIRKNIFEKIILNKEKFNINDLMSYKLIKLYILEINKCSNIFSFITEKDMIVLTSKFGDDIYGFDILWDILIKTENKEIQNDLSDFLRDIILGIKYREFNNYKQYWTKIVNKIIENLKQSIDNNNKDNNFQVKGLILLIKKIIDESMNNGGIIEDKKIIDKIFEKINNNNNNNKNDELNIINENPPIKVIFEYPTEINDKMKKKKKKQNLSKETDECEIYAKEFFYQLRYYISYKFRIPLKLIEIEIPNETNPSKDKKKNEEENKKNNKLNIFNDFININYEYLNEFINKNNKKEEKSIKITIRQIENPFNDDKIENIQNIINSNKELSPILMKLLKNKNGDYTKDIWNMIKDKDNFNEIEIFNNFNDLLNNRNNDMELLNEICNFKDTSMFYKNYILSSLYKFLSKDNEEEEKQLVNKLINSNLWTKKIKNLLKEYNEKKNNDKNKNTSINDSIEEKNYILNILNIYKKITDNIPENNENLEFIINEIFNICFDIIKDSVYLDFNSLNKEDINNNSNNIYGIKKSYLNILNYINDIFIKNVNSISFLKLMDNEDQFNENESEFMNKFIFCFIEGILKNNYPFLNEKISKLLISITKNTEDQNKNNELKKSYILICSTIFCKENNERVLNILKELFNDKIDNNKKINIYEYNLKLYYKTIGEILKNIYKCTYDEFDYEKYIIENVIPYIYEPLLKDIKKENILHDLYFGGQCIILYNYIQVMNNINIDEQKYSLIFNYKNKTLKDYLFNEIIMYKCDKDVIPLINKYRKGKKIKIINSLIEANHLFISIIIRELKEENNKYFVGGDLMYYLEKIDYFNKRGYWKGNQVSDWKLNFREEVNSTSFIGLQNLGCTCYLNSLLQVFYHIIPFRESLLKCSCKEEKKNSLYETKKIFKSLKSINDSNYYTPKSFVNNFDNEKLNIHQQMDVDEFFANILDKLENRLKNTENENIIKYFFQGRLNDALTFQKGCTHHRINENTFYSIQLQVQNRKNIYESLDTLIEGELMSGDNCIFCPQCNKKFPAIKSQNFKILPRMLMFVLKRFEFNYDTMRKIKINDRYEFPLELDMNKYTNEYINNKNNKQNNKYVLKSVVVHQGNSEGGHYYAFIKDNLSQTWYKFNDTKVNKFDINNIANETFGGKDDDKQIEKNKSAYLLFYEKIDDTNCDSFDHIKAIISLNKRNEENEEFSLFENNNENNNENTINEINIDDNDKENLNEESYTNYLNKVLFSNEYHHFTLELYINILNNIDNENNTLPLLFENFYLKSNDHPFQTELYYHERNIKLKGSNITKYINKEKLIIFNDSVNNYSEEEKKTKIIDLFKFILINFYNIIIRSREKKYFGCHVDLIKFLINRYEHCANYLLEEFSCYNVIFEYLVNCPLYEMKKVIVGIIYYAMNKSIEPYKKIE